MHPVLFKIGPFVIYSYGTMLSIAFIMSVLLVFVRARQNGLKEEIIISMSFYVIVAAIIGARFLYVILNLKKFLNTPFEILMIHHGGLVFYGGLLGGVLGSIFYTRQKKLPVAQIFDIIAPYLALGQAIARIGCLLNGCCYGRPISVGTSCPGFIFPSDSIAGIQFPEQVLHPTQLYSSIANIGIFLLLLRWSGFKKKNGEIFAGYLLLYSVKRFFIEFLRGDSSVLFFSLTLFQLISICLGIVALVWIIGVRIIGVRS